MIYVDTSVLGTVSATVRGDAMRAFHRFASTELQVVEVETIDFRTAAQLIDHAGSLRAGDALHLAVEQRLRARLATLDRRIGQAASTCGVDTLRLLA